MKNNNGPPEQGLDIILKQSPKVSCFARLEYKGVQPEIAALLEQGGGSAKYAYAKLLEEGRLTMTYHTFRQYVRDDGHRTSRMKKAAAPEPLDPPGVILDLTELDPDGPGACFGYDLNAVYQDLAGLGVVSSGYSDFSDHFQESQI